MNRCFKTFLLLTFICAGILVPLISSAVEIIVTDNGNSTDQMDGVCTLREAITAANTDTGSVNPGDCIAGSGDDVIHFALPNCSADPGDQNNCTIRPGLGQSHPIITENLTIEGPGNSPVIIDPTGDDIRAFVLDSGSMNQTLTLQNLTLQRATHTGSNGGAVVVNTGDDNLAIDNCIFEMNTALLGGTLEFRGNDLTILNSRFTDNESTAGGGGALRINSSGSTKIENSVFNSNEADTGAGGGSGGAIQVTGGGTLSINNTTLSGNRAALDGGGLYVTDGTIHLNNVTLAFNIADSDSDNMGEGGGLYVFTAATAVNIRNSILYGNLGDGGPDCFGLSTDIFSQQYNIIGDETDCTGIFGLGTNDQVGVDPQFRNLRDIQSTTLLHPFQENSPARDGGNPAGCTDENAIALTTDQRGLGFPRTVGAACDVGAYEYGTCGDGGLDNDEECDDGNNVDGDGCQADCRDPFCGDGVVDLGEGCDDGNNVDGDGCQADCALPTCGDGIIDPDEECEDGNLNNNDDCLNTCMNASCGDQILHTGLEECDDGNANSDIAPDACRTDCSLPFCGDGVRDSDETCDDGNLDDGDGCSAQCETETDTIPVSGENGGCALEKSEKPVWYHVWWAVLLFLISVYFLRKTVKEQ